MPNLRISNNDGMTTTQYKTYSFDHGTYDSCLKAAETALLAKRIKRGVIRWLQGASNFASDDFAPELITADWRCKYGPRKCRALRRSLVGDFTSDIGLQRLLDKGIDKLSTARVAIGSTRWRENMMDKDTLHDAKGKKNREKTCRSAISTCRA